MTSDASSGYSRRRFLTTSIAAAGALSASAWPALGAMQRGKPGGNTTRYPLHIPSVVDFATEPQPLTLTCAPTRLDLGGNRLSDVWAYNGSFPGPTLSARQGTSVSIDLVNSLPEETITHWHGMIVDGANDGGPHLAVGPGGQYSYAFPVPNRACMNWYHPHPHMMTGMQVNLGLAGAFIIRDDEEDALGLPWGNYEIPLIIRDVNYDKSGNIIYNPRTSGFEGKSFLVNGTRDPGLDVTTALYRFRVLNGSSARIYLLALSNGAQFTVIGNDGGLLAAPVNVNRIELAPAERLDLVVSFRGMSLGTKVNLVDVNTGWNLLEFNVTGTNNPPSQVPSALSTIALLGTPVSTRTFSFDGMSRINGLEFEMDRIDFRVPFGDVEQWTFNTAGNAPHPVHVHGASFQIVARRGGRGQVFPWESGWKDTVLLQDQESVDIRIRFDRLPHYVGDQRYLIHCHKLEHEDMGMMSNFEVY